ncbi:nicotinamidase-related amidase [Clostridium acetobutylicum]|uniref:Amidase from nicotinamidase family n=1 Tax=Clostridium acetobutylicum (strain ATCC 824 / DSM 792 / JCM 1419 / IAM 19013 / LMG 5710 / NBRC 13948 / NRRL B-527 / VKM B-1787 / 2291 / W) TaxID=272562 RepID=Q97DL0_CLOAB|nr:MULTISPECIES: cysteine hydrolase family protein [Clostridium]AAK81393.1 Amidase from nicotinamidase family [Clostridium acetobutylicum ATCC 824]ADZ22506.1 Amidase from nicotinamidase family [Clostridium acetobutylicum EA 2018]AEI33731.1 amidase [Clostridium acetobutylicum DSM 1731]AWV80939.1 cysteine hydrolase [Clostridium acetobutylicum]MBC2393739.1 cysteine hydrolase [Clostridium acetobutylicum]
MNNVVLMVVDAQNGLIKKKPYNHKNVIENIKKLIIMARANNKEVVYVRHDDGEGTELEKGTEGWQIYSELEPKSGEFIIEKKYNSAFHRTDLKEYLESKNTDTIILVGLQTEYCIDATLKSAFDNEYKVIIPKDTNTTFDNEYLSGEKLYKFYNYKIWNKRFARVISMEDTLNRFIID